MNTQLDIENKLRELKPLLQGKFAFERIGYFGSYSRDELTKESDIDIAVYFRKPIG